MAMLHSSNLTLGHDSFPDTMSAYAFVSRMHFYLDKVALFVVPIEFSSRDSLLNIGLAVSGFASLRAPPGY